MNGSKLRSLQPYVLSILRIIAGFVMMPYGIRKLWGLWAVNGTPAPVGSLLWYGGIIETFGGALILLGLFTVPVAFLFSGEMAVAYFRNHAPRGLLVPVNNGGAAAVLFCFIFLYLFCSGPGPWSLDHAIARMRRKSQ